MAGRTPHNSVESNTIERRRTALWLNQGASSGRWFIVKLVALGLVNAIALYGLFVTVLRTEWLLFAVLLVLIAAIDFIYLRRPDSRSAQGSTGGRVAAKYLAPGLVFLLIFQVFVIGYTAFIGFTNYGTGHNGSKEDAVIALLASAQSRVPDSPTYPVTVVERVGVYGLLVTDPDGDAFVGTSDRPLEPVPDAEFDGDVAVTAPGWTTLSFQDVLANQATIFEISVPLSDDLNDGSLRTQDGRSAYVFKSTLSYDEAADTMTNTETGVVYSDIGTGAYTSEDGEEILPGWRVVVGFDNFARAFGTESIRGPLISVTLWTFAFALLSVATTFVLGLFLAIVFNDARMRGRKFYRVLLILPYAFPAFLSALVWAGMLSESFGFVNQVLLGGASIPWLTDPTLAKFSLIMVNLWLGFPYMFIVCTGALQSIPEELTEAAKVDGASSWNVLRLVKLPLLMVSVAPLLIASFAFNFNNFNLVYMLTGGGPREVGAGVNVGATDILISMVYKIAFTGQLRDYGLASAFSIIIFLLVAAISIISFRRTKALEDIN